MKDWKERRWKKRAVLLAALLFVMVLCGGRLFALRAASAVSEADTALGWNLILVNSEHRVPDDWKNELTTLSNGERVDSRIYPDLQRMFDAARADGYHLFVRAGYRTHQEQQKLMRDKIQAYREEGYSKQEANKLAADYVAQPGTSEHELGISVDINADTTQSDADAVYAWLEEHAYQYGFVKRYPADKTAVTGISNEPWHYRYVGLDAAKTMKEQNLCLEEYLAQREQS